MPADLLLDYLKNSSGLTQIQFQVVFQCAPVLKGVKASNIITLPKGMWQELNKELEDSRIAWLVLATGKTKDVVLLYRSVWLHNILENSGVKNFLSEYGYEHMELPQILTKLQERYQTYSQGQAEFPHELGIFLQYPLEDVRGFIDNGGKNSLLSGYWKVYHNPVQARRVFHMYDRVREKAAIEFINGYTPKQIAIQIIQKQKSGG